MALNLWALSYILEVARTGSISKASQNLYLSQSHLSNTIKMAEKELNVSIFRRTTRGMILTSEGEIFVKKAQAILADMSSLEQVFSTPPEDTFRVRISMVRCYRIHNLIMQLINQNAQKPHFLAHVKETNPFQVVDDVHSGTADFGIVGFFDAQKDYFINSFKANSLDYTFHYSRDCLLMMSDKNPLASEPRITSDMLENQIAVVYGDYESIAASYAVITENSGIVLAKRRIYAYDRASGLEMLSGCPDTYTWFSGVHTDVLTGFNLVMRKCEDISAQNLVYTIHSSNAELTPLSLDIRRRMSEIGELEF